MATALAPAIHGPVRFVVVVSSLLYCIHPLKQWPAAHSTALGVSGQWEQGSCSVHTHPSRCFARPNPRSACQNQHLRVSLSSSAKLARAAILTPSTDWPTLRDHLHLALTSSLDVYAQIGKPRSSWETIVSEAGPYTYPQSSPIGEDRRDDKPPSDSLLLSPSASTSQLEEAKTHDVDPNNDMTYRKRYDLVPSTPGGLVIAPFPPLRPRSEHSWQGSVKVNGQAKTHPSLVDSEWNEDIVIGGKILPGYMEEEQAKKEIERVGKMLEDMEEYVALTNTFWAVVLIPAHLSPSNAWQNCYSTHQRPTRRSASSCAQWRNAY